MHILISNDDGIAAAGLRALAAALLEGGHRVTVCAPDRERSASGHALTLHETLDARRVTDFGGCAAWSVSGTPADCVRLGLTTLAEGPVDLVVSGVNHGPNLGSDTLYSGTVAAAMEALLLNHPALAVSLGSKRALNYLGTAARWARRVTDWLERRGLDAGGAYNLNVPALEDGAVRGVRAATLARTRYVNGYDRVPDGYRLRSWPEVGEDEPDSDAALLRAGYATLTPLTWSMLNAPALKELNTFEGGF